MKKLLLLWAMGVACIHHGVFALTIGGFDGSRAGDLSLRDGTSELITPTRDAIEESFPGVTITATNTLTEAYLSTVDVVVLASLTTAAPGSFNFGGTSLSGAEQAALLNFVQNGGGAVIFGESDNFPQDAVNETFFDPFQMDITGRPNLSLSPGNTDRLSVTNAAHPVIEGPFGTIIEEGPGYFAYGWLNNLGPYASEIMTILDDAGGESTGVAVIEAGAIVEGSGAVVLFSDTWTYWQGFGNPQQNAILTLNAFAFAAGVEPAEPVPTLTEWGIIALIVLLAGAAFVHVRKLQGDLA